MRIQVKSGEHCLNIPIPTALVFSKPSVWLYLKLARKFSSRTSQYIPEDIEISLDQTLERIPDKAVYALCDELVRINRKYGSWTLVEVESADGQQVIIRL